MSTRRSHPEAVDVVIPTFDARELVTACVRRLLGDPAIGRVIVVDDASSDDTVEHVRRELQEITLVALDRHRGLAYALNRGAARAEAGYVLFLNNDVLACAAAVERLVAALDGDPQAVSAGGRLVDPGTTRTQTSYEPREIPGLTGLIVRLAGIERHWPRNPWTGRHLTAPLDAHRPQRTARQPAGACLMVRRSALLAVGGWDERYWMWYEDVDMSRRLRELGPALYVPDALFEHVGGASTRGWRRHEQHLRLYHGTMAYAQAHLSRCEQRVVGALMLAVCLPRYVIAAATRADAAPTYRQLLASAAEMCRLRPVPTPRPGLERPRSGV
jgi:GT2 family glycosyltransferase